MKDFDKIVKPGTGKLGYTEQHGIYCHIIYKDEKLSITGVEGPKSNGDCFGSCGQILDHLIDDIEIYAENWNKKLLIKFVDIWDKWHLNDMNAACKHQKELWDLYKKVELINYTSTMKYFKMLKSAENAKLSIEEYKKYKKITEKIRPLLYNINRPKYLTKEINEMINEGWIKEKSREKKAVNWINEKEHPEGILSKSCPVCGYKYGSAWLKEDVPEDVLSFLYNLPDSNTRPAWI